ncbi:tRNA pseudouridine(38-40) synthase TruA [Formosa algae]|uniref:tRNA pseudouridine synthase A n=1 Tax=Formosa algae TaxID=225843 RepID=A0A9X1CAW5_9FLAO|nr:tRNA pseudouridine(38-40) synthase TruA [Formosa algae]MBP1839432.1 tRNA pseudouridine38-40 synthase [Formosa algae]MDQ0334736.1 tRNA pseudouridine38-40 synthase [Formosa algae]OEI81988.1 tRNA pseudouridine(38-40) synthase TruA [Formosa algae]
MRYFLELSYNGKAYHGWQNQPNAISVQEVIETALSVILKQKIAIMGAGRTDTGVHAKQMFAHFDFEDTFNSEELQYKLNSYLPKDVAIHRIFKVKADAHTRFHATSRTYLYRIALQKNVFNFEEAYWVKPKLNVEHMKTAANLLLAYKDFQCFSKSNTDVKTYNCDIMAVHLEVVDTELHFTITADRFLRNMVRAIVGTLINVGLNKLDVEDIHRIISSKSRSEAGYSVPAKGLYLTHITYPESIIL